MREIMLSVCLKGLNSEGAKVFYAVDLHVFLHQPGRNGQWRNDQLSINTIRFLSVDPVQQANSGHPGLPLGAVPMAYCGAVSPA